MGTHNGIAVRASHPLVGRRHAASGVKSSSTRNGKEPARWRRSSGFGGLVSFDLRRTWRRGSANLFARICTALQLKLRSLLNNQFRARQAARKSTSFSKRYDHLALFNGSNSVHPMNSSSTASAMRSFSAATNPCIAPADQLVDLE